MKNLDKNQEHSLSHLTLIAIEAALQAGTLLRQGMVSPSAPAVPSPQADPCDFQAGSGQGFRPR